jgi:serine/threonine protein kinase
VAAAGGGTAAAAIAAAGSVARRLAAAKANPQLAKTLDANSPLADNYSLLGVLGKGSYGEVRLAIHKLTKQKVAVKTLARAKLSDEKLRKRAAVETKLHQKLRHPHVARLFEVITSPAAICLCMQYASGGTLRDVLDTAGALPEPRARRYARQMCAALHYCHRTMHVVHRDLKLDNMLLDAHDNILLADFGFAEYVGPANKRLRLLCGSPHYSAPEIFAQQEYSGTAADMWSLGVLLYTMLAGHFPFQAESMDALGKKVMKGKPDRPLHAPPIATELVHQLLVVRASQRASIEAVCEHFWLAPAAGEPPLDVHGTSATPWDEGVGARLEASGCPLALVHHHVNAGASNHVTAAYEILLHGDGSGAGATGGGAGA